MSLPLYKIDPYGYKGKSIYVKTYKLRLIQMGNIKVILPDDLEKKFRAKVYERYGMKKGNITIAILDAVKTWTEKEKVKNIK